MKKIFCLMLIFALLLVMSVPVFADAAPPEIGGGDTALTGGQIALICILVAAVLCGAAAALRLLRKRRK